jgi:hypothetical protein
MNNPQEDTPNDEDIVDVLTDFAYIVDESKGVAVVTMLNGSLFLDAASEIKRLRDAGDSLAEGVRMGRWDDALDTWEDVRRG